MGVVRLMLEQIDRGRTIEYSRKKSLSADEGIMDYKPQDKTRSNPSFGQRLSLSFLPKASRAASWNNSATALAALKRRRSSGGASARLSNEHYDYLGVGSRTGTGFLDPRRHSYGCSGTSSANSLLTGGVCEGPFSSSPFHSGQISRRPSAPIFDRNVGSANYCRNSPFKMP
ncbi:unnamed protein product [Taenia asiatica]|uniref:DUF4005 domain-containing protein n=1 Tax=Taenia asiatica TaxID=60517 RepID=A0A158R744_TAEAS|nr:unnamed protein product [Taenia asiatica]